MEGKEVEGVKNRKTKGYKVVITIWTEMKRKEWKEGNSRNGCLRKEESGFLMEGMKERSERKE